MNLRKRINKLQEDNKQVYLHSHSLFTFDGYNAGDAVVHFWLMAIAFIVIAFVLFWVGTGIYFSDKASTNPAIVAQKIQEGKDKRASAQKAKQQYVDSCKQTGKAPTDMSDDTVNWECK